jgi:hypothetical protein
VVRTRPVVAGKVLVSGVADRVSAAMSEPQTPPPSPQAGIADALTDLTQQTRTLVREEITSAQRETWDKLLASAPAAGLLAAAGGFGLLSVASGYRASLRMLERRLSPVAAALTATVVYGLGAAATAVWGVQRLRAAPMPFPSTTVQDAGARVGQTAAEVRRASGGHAAP